MRCWLGGVEAGTMPVEVEKQPVRFALVRAGWGWAGSDWFRVGWDWLGSVQDW